MCLSAGLSSRGACFRVTGIACGCNSGSLLGARAATYHVATGKGDSEESRHYEEDAEQLLVAQQDFSFSLATLQHF